MPKQALPGGGLARFLGAGLNDSKWLTPAGAQVLYGLATMRR
jgi:hypothetical protein